MKENSYTQYVSESSGWLHTGRSALVERLLGFFLPNSSKNLDILEVGAGVGQNVSTLCNYGSVDVLEVDQQGLNALYERRDVREVIAEGIPCKLNLQYDVICALDVIEHLEDDEAAMLWISENLKPGGVLLITVPAHQWFFSQHDVALGHFRRYTRATFRRIIPESFELLADSHFNTRLFPIAIVSRMAWIVKNWFISEKDQSKQSMPTHGLVSQMLLSVFMKEVEGTTQKTSRGFGLSYYACMRKKC